MPLRPATTSRGGHEDGAPAVNANDREAIIGAGVLFAGALILGLAYQGRSHAEVKGYDLSASFNRAEGVGVGTDVRLAGVNVGKVIAQNLGDHFRAVLTFRVSPDVKIPADSAALIYTDGLLGGKFIALQPGGDEEDMKPGQQFLYTQDAVNVPELLELIIAQGKAKRAGTPLPTPTQP